VESTNQVFPEAFERRHAHGSHAIERGAAILMASPFEVVIKP
jgi:hypothetical protein